MFFQDLEKQTAVHLYPGQLSIPRSNKLVLAVLCLLMKRGRTKWHETLQISYTAKLGEGEKTEEVVEVEVEEVRGRRD